MTKLPPNLWMIFTLKSQKNFQNELLNHIPVKYKLIRIIKSGRKGLEQPAKPIQMLSTLTLADITIIMALLIVP